MECLAEEDYRDSLRLIVSCTARKAAWLKSSLGGRFGHTVGLFFVFGFGAIFFDMVPVCHLVKRRQGPENPNCTTTLN